MAVPRPTSKLLWLVLLLGALVGAAAFANAKRKAAAPPGGQAGTSSPPVIPPTDTGAAEEPLPVAGTASSDGGLGAAGMER